MNATLSICPRFLSIYPNTGAGDDLSRGAHIDNEHPVRWLLERKKQEKCETQRIQGLYSANDEWPMTSDE